uniref:Uncharacterized protein n=1 Tax=Palpitomonas bilix TaxID=652834 RepID=A0A7S3DDT7_9EUKA|mmetsp:Transcript_32854/g.84852  ORF Transcript_32854/g.84852 Transcript_32854/m.84852 type:complete len:103 (+) Transcript_32854:112-420(+)
MAFKLEPSPAKSSALGSSPRESVGVSVLGSARNYVDEFGVVRKRKVTSREKKREEYLQRQEKAKKAVAVTDVMRSKHTGMPTRVSADADEVEKAIEFEKDAM